MKSRLYNILIGSLLSIIFISHPLWLGVNFEKFSLTSFHTITSLFVNAIIIIAYLAHYYYLIDHFYFKNKANIYFLISIGLLILLVLGCGAFSYFFDPSIQNHNLKNYLLHCLNQPKILLLYITSLLLAFFLIYQKKLKQIQDINNRTRIAFLNAQLQPHFLFNTLNNIYGQSLNENAPTTSSSIQKLSGLLRYIVENSHKNMINLEDEIEFIENYITLQKERFSTSIPIEYNIYGDPSNLKIAPLILITFIENAFKYGVNVEGNSKISILINIMNNKSLLCLIKNNKPKVNNLENLGVGLANTKERLAFLYPYNYGLTINNNKHFHEVILKLNLK